MRGDDFVRPLETSRRPAAGGTACGCLDAILDLAGVIWSHGYGTLAGAVSVAVIATVDGRELAYEQVGDPSGVAIFVLHGTPGCRLSGRHPDPSRVSAAGLRLVSYDRPGYGRSSRYPGRRVIDCVSDVAAIADELEIERFAVRGGSGGGPHALAVAARLPERVTGVGCDVGAAPYDAADLDWVCGDGCEQCEGIRLGACEHPCR
jgi:hypothetical protein